MPAALPDAVFINPPNTPETERTTPEDVQ